MSVDTQAGACPHSCTYGDGLTLVGELAAGEAELAAQRLEHAAHHAAAALFAAPLDSRAQALLDALTRVAPRVEALFPVREGAFLGYAAALAYVGGKQGRLGLALSLVLALQRDAPGRAFAEWVAPWFRERTAVKRLSGAEAARGLEAFAKPYARGLHPPPLSPPDRAALEVLWPTLLRILKAYPREPSLQTHGSVCARALGDAKLARSLAQRAHAVAPCVGSAYVLGLAQRELGDLAGALKSMKQAASLAPDAVDLRVELGDLQLALGKPKSARAWYTEAQTRGPEDPAVALGFLALAAAEGEEVALEGLRTIATQTPAHSHARRLMKVLGHPLPEPVPFGDWLPDPVSSLLNVLAQAREGRAGGVLFTCTLGEAPEPSAWLAFLRIAEEAGLQHAVRVLAEAPELPEVPTTLWTYSGGLPTPALEPPPAELLAEVARIAALPYDLTAWTQEARALDLGEAAIPGLLACFVHPPPGPAAATWIARAQVATALCLVHAGGPWETRRAACDSVIGGPVDWSSLAVALALSTLDEPDALVDSRRWCEELHALNADLLWPGALAPLERRSTASPAERADLPAATPPDYSRGDPGAGG